MLCEGSEGLEERRQLIVLVIKRGDLCDVSDRLGERRQLSV